ncbi:MAG: YwiC-like family protein [Bryobacteraceae bacterium]|nr:YwiC-like family protein [Bryobacteraceae bacterium]MDW8380205.1 YwiC-like family protein [Bryobacterales bacterium]
MLLPREHGAWGMLLIPFAAACLLAGRWTSDLLVALLAVLVVFVLRQPLIVVGRQRWVWRDPRPETELARRDLLWEIPLLAGCGLWLAVSLPLIPLLLLGGMAAGLTGIAVWMTLHNRQRSLWLQLASAFGLGSSALLVSLVSTHQFETWAWWLWIFCSLHSLSGVLTVHARLDQMASARNPRLQEQARRMRWGAAAAALAQLALGAAVAGANWPYAIPFVFSGLLHLVELWRIHKPEPLKRVGFRALAISLLHATASVAVLAR